MPASARALLPLLAAALLPLCLPLGSAGGERSASLRAASARGVAVGSGGTGVAGVAEGAHSPERRDSGYRSVEAELRPATPARPFGTGDAL